MSQPPSPPKPPPKPNWFRNQASDREVREQPSAGESEPTPAQTNSDDAVISSEVSRPKTAKKPAMRIANIPQFFLTLKADVSTIRPILGFMAWLRHELDTNREGLLTSIGLHSLLLILFGLWVLPTGGQGRPTILNAGWTPLPSKSVKDAMSQPVKLESLQLSPVKTSTGFTPTKDKTNDQKPDERSGAASQQAKPVGVGDALAGRTGAGRSAIFQNMKIDSKTERGISVGLAWLVRQQGKGGNWRLHEGGYPNPGDRTIRTDTGATALALLALLGDGHTTTEGQHSKAVAKGIAFLKSIQKANGDLHDHEELGRQTAFYAHSQATIALCEAYALTGDPFLKQPCQQAVKFLLESQHPQNGGWRYQPQAGSSMGDLSVTGWALMALHSARMAKFDVPFDNFERAALFLDSVSEQQGARYKYQPADPSSKVSPAMTAEGVLCRQWLGWPKDHPQHVDAIEYLLSEDHRPEWKPGKRNVYAWYYTAQVLHNLGGQRWTEWYDHVGQQILDRQVAGGRTPGNDILGSWSPKIGKELFGANEEYAEKAGRLYLTAMCLLVLETPFRHTPIYQPEKTQ